MGGVALGGRRATHAEGRVIGAKVCGMLHGAIERAEICGSIRRGKPEIGDVDLVVIGNDALDARLRSLCGSQKNGKPGRKLLVDGVQVDIVVTTSEAWGAALMHCTGSKDWNIHQRTKARSLGLMLNEKGLWEGEKRIAGATEAEVYEALGDRWVSPDGREVTK